MRVGYLKLVRQERFNTKRGWFVNAWRIVDEQGQDRFQPWCNTRGDALRLAKRLGIYVSKVIVQVKGWNTYVTLREHCKVKSESDLFYQIKLELQHMGYDCIKRVPGRDGHMTSAPYYIRERNSKWCILDERHEIRNPEEEINKHGSVMLRAHWAPPVPKEGNRDQQLGTPVEGIGEH